MVGHTKPMRRKDKKDKTERVCFEICFPETKEGLIRLMERIVKPPEHPKFQKYDQEQVVSKFAKEHGVNFRNVTALFQPQHNANVGKTLEALEIIATMALKDTNTLFFFEATAYNLEAASFLAFVAQNYMIGQYRCNTAVLCYTWLGEESFATWCAMPETDLRTGMMALLPEWECPICLESVSSVQGVKMLWSCTHGICNVCYETKLEDMIKRNMPCPMCRSKITLHREQRVDFSVDTNNIRTS